VIGLSFCGGVNINVSPEKTQTAEVGTKRSLFNKKRLLSAAIFRTNSENNAVLDTTSNEYVQYIAALNQSGYRYTPRAPRTWMLTANVHC